LVVIEMGHNDDVDLSTDTADRGTLPGIGEDSVTITTSTGESEVVFSFGHYLRKMIKDVQAVGGIPILSGMVNRNYWDGTTLQSDWQFAIYAQQVSYYTWPISLY
jgi:rhamnogalacturonan acetylesterase